MKFLEKCKEYCDFLIVGVYTDEVVSSYKRKPIIPFEERVELIKALKPVDMVVRVDKKDNTHILKELVKEGWQISLLFHGDNWKADQVEGKEYIESIGGKLIQPSYYEGQSSTKIIEKIRGMKP